MALAALGCQQAPPEKPQPAPRPVAIETAVITSTESPRELAALEVGLVEFDPGIPADTASHIKLGIFPEIRRAEASYLPYALRETLVESNHWGPVRVLPDAESGSELLVEGTILQSDGVTLRLQVLARDATGRIWLQREYGESTGKQDYQVEQQGVRPFKDLYNQVANDLYDVLRGLDDRELQEIRQVAVLRYAQTLAPDAFEDYLSRNAEGHYTALRLPARDDPMLARIEGVKRQEHIFIDTVDEQYALLYSDMTPTYDLWRQFNREQALYREQREKRLADREAAPRGSYTRMKQTYGAFKWAKLQEQELRQLAEGFHNEVAPTSMEIEGRVVRLAGGLDERYREWRRILRQIYALETGGN
jgi:hypothetical protein